MSLPYNLNGPTLARSSAMVFGLLGCTVGLRGVLQPPGFAQIFGIPLSASSKPVTNPTSESTVSHPFIRALGASTIGSGLALIALGYQKNDRALGVCLMTGLIPSFTNGYLVLKHKEGRRDAAFGHIGVHGVLTALGVYLYLKDPGY